MQQRLENEAFILRCWSLLHFLPSPWAENRQQMVAALTSNPDPVFSVEGVFYMFGGVHVR